MWVNFSWNIRHIKSSHLIKRKSEFFIIGSRQIGKNREREKGWRRTRKKKYCYNVCFWLSNEKSGQTRIRFFVKVPIEESGVLVFWKVVLWIHPRDQNKTKPSFILFVSYKPNIHARTGNKGEGMKWKRRKEEAMVKFCFRERMSNKD